MATIKVSEYPATRCIDLEIEYSRGTRIFDVPDSTSILIRLDSASFRELIVKLLNANRQSRLAKLVKWHGRWDNG